MYDKIDNHPPNDIKIPCSIIKSNAFGNVLLSKYGIGYHFYLSTVVTGQSNNPIIDYRTQNDRHLLALLFWVYWKILTEEFDRIVASLWVHKGQAVIDFYSFRQSPFLKNLFHGFAGPWKWPLCHQYVVDGIPSGIAINFRSSSDSRNRARARLRPLGAIRQVSFLALRIAGPVTAI